MKPESTPTPAEAESDLTLWSADPSPSPQEPEFSPIPPTKAAPPAHREAQIDLCSTRLESQLKDFVRAARDGDHGAVLKLAEEFKPMLSQLRALYSESAVKRYLFGTTAAGFHKTLYREALSQGLPITGENLRYTLAGIQLRVDPENLTIELAGKVHKTVRVPAILKLVHHRLTKTKRTARITFAPDALLAKLHHGYLNHVQHPGEELPLKTLYQEIIAEVGGNLQYTNADFEDDLSALFHLDTLSYNGVPLEHAPSKDPQMNYRVRNRYGREVQIGSIRFGQRG